MNSSKTSGFSPSELASLSVWRMPDVMGTSEAVDLAEILDVDPLPIPVLTVDEIEAMQKQAYDEAFAQGKKDGQAQGFNEGSKQGYAENAQALQSKAAEFERLLESLSQPFAALDAEVEKELVKLAIGISTQIIRREIKLDPGQVIAAVREAVKVLPLSSQKINLHLHPEDAELVRSALSLDVSIHTRPHPPGDTRRQIEAGGLCLPVNVEVTEKDNDVGASLSNLRNPPEEGGFRPARCFDEMSTAWKIVEDPLITRGGCKVNTEVSHIDATVENRLAAVIATLFGGDREQDKPL